MSANEIAGTLNASYHAILFALPQSHCYAHVQAIVGSVADEYVQFVEIRD